MKRFSLLIVAAALFGVAFVGVIGMRRDITLKQARSGFVSKLIPQSREKTPVPASPSKRFHIVAYDSPKGKLAAYASIDPNDGKRHPVIIWISGGDSHSIDASFWEDQDISNDQSAKQYREAGLLMMYPSLRGGNDNPGEPEGFLGEADDVVAAADYLAKLSYVDPNRIYLGGHSTGGTLVLLSAELSSKFRAVFAFGPVDDIGGYGSDSGFTPFDASNSKERELRSPGLWLSSIKCPVFVFEGEDGGNIDSLLKMKGASKNPLIRFSSVEGASHFSILGPVNRVIANKILGDTGKQMNIQFNTASLNRLFLK